MTKVCIPSHSSLSLEVMHKDAMSPVLFPSPQSSQEQTGKPKLRASYKLMDQFSYSKMTGYEGKDSNCQRWEKNEV